MITAHQDIAGDGGGIGLLPPRTAVIEVLGLQHSHLNGLAAGAGQLHKVQIAIVIAETVTEAVAGAVVVLQMGGLQLPHGHMGVGGGQPYPNHNIAVLVGGNRPRRGSGQTQGQKSGGKLHKSFLHSVLHFSAFQ